MATKKRAAKKVTTHARSDPRESATITTDNALRLDLGLLAGTIESRAHRSKDDKAFRELCNQTALILRALESDLSDRARGVEKGGELFAAVVEKSKYHLRTKNRGPRTRKQEAIALRNLVRSSLELEHTPEVIAHALLKRLQFVWPLLAADTEVPGPGPWPERSRALADVASVIKKFVEQDKRDPERIAIAVMRKLGCPKGSAESLFNY